MTMIGTAKEREKLAGLDGHTDGPWRCSRPDMVTHTMGGEQVSFLYLDDGPRVEFQTTNPVEDARLAAAAPDLKRDYGKALDALDAQAAEIERLRKVLEFYADPDADGLTCANGHDRCAEGPLEGCPYCERTPIPDFYDELDFGERARAALSEREP